MEKFEERESVSFEHEGKKIFGVIHRPLVQGKCPAVLIVHGLAGHRFGKHRMYVTLSEKLSHIGIASFRFDFSGQGDSEGSFSEMTIHGEVEETVKAFQLLENDPLIDSKRIGLYGRSFGAAVAIKAAHEWGKVKSAALWAPVFNAEQWEKQWEMIQTQELDENERHEMMRINGQLPSINFYKELFQLKLDDELKTLSYLPMLIIHGEQDPLVGIEHSLNYAEARKTASGKTEFVRLEHSDHDFTHPDERVHATNLTCRFFGKTL